MRCAIWYHLHNLKIVKNTHGGVLLIVKLQAKSITNGSSLMSQVLTLTIIDCQVFKLRQILKTYSDGLTCLQTVLRRKLVFYSVFITSIHHSLYKPATQSFIL